MFRIRVDDLDRVRPGAAERQLDDLAAIGLDWDGDVLWQSDRLAAYGAAVSALERRGLVYECYCTRREIQQAAAAPHAPQGAYPGTCRELTDAARAERRVGGRPPALRLRSEESEFTIHDVLHGDYTGLVDDLVLQRGDGTPAYNLTVVVDDDAQRIDQVVRGDDLLPSTPRQAYLAQLLGLAVPQYAHVPLALNVEGRRLAKRDGAVTLADQRALGRTAAQVRGLLADSLGMSEFATPRQLLAEFDPDRLPREPWTATTH